jgi:hypothetical protein
MILAACVPELTSMPPIIGAARDGDTTRLGKLLHDGADPDVIAGVNNWTPLMHAIHKNQAGSVRVLLHNGAHVDARGGRGMTALIMAAGYGYDGIVRMLLDAGADPYAVTDKGLTALGAAVGAVSDIDRFTVGRCQTETVRVLLAHTPDLAARDTDVRRALATARLGGCAEVVRLVGKVN